jgi:hypothetical protein
VYPTINRSGKPCSLTLAALIRLGEKYQLPRVRVAIKVDKEDKSAVRRLILHRGGDRKGAKIK